MSATTTDWSSGEQIGSVILPDGRRLWLHAAGPTRETTATPAVVLVHGLGGTALEWLAVHRHIAQSARVYLYERAGYHGSDESAQQPTAANIAADLHALLTTAGVQPPFLLVGHSYGGVIINQFLAHYTTDVFGMVIIDSSPVVDRVPAVWTKLLGGAEYEDVVGLHANLGIPEEEYQQIRLMSDANEAAEGIAAREVEHQAPANQQLWDSIRGKQLLGDRRLAVVFCDESHDFWKIYQYGVEHGYGAAGEQETIRRHLVDMSQKDEAAQREQLALSSNAKFVRADGKRATHNVHVVDPEWVAHQIKWVLDGTEPE